MTRKNTLRQSVLGFRRSLSLEAQAQKSQTICEILENLTVFKNAKTLLFYYPVNGEVDLRPLFEKYRTEKQFFLPAIMDENIFEARPLPTLLALTPGKKGIPEPAEGLPAAALDLIVVPGVVFDLQGHRIGTGKGYYDRFLLRYPGAFKIGVAYHEQIVENVPQDPYDVPMDLVLNDQKTDESPLA